MTENGLNRFWRTLECLRGRPAVLAQWRLCLADEFRCVEPLLRPTGELGSSFPRSDPFCRRGYRRPCEVQQVGDDAFRAVPPEGGQAFEVDAAQLALYELHRPRLTELLADACGFRPADEPVEGLPATHRVGMLVPTAGYRFPVFLSLPHSAEDLRRTVDRLVAETGGPFLLLVPTDQSLDALGERALQRCGGAVLPLSESVALDGDCRFALTQCGQERIERFQREHLPAQPSAEPVRFFPTPPEACWGDVRVRFVDGETVSVRVGEVSAVLNYTQMGMASAKNGRPTLQWELLRAFAAGHGLLDWSSPAAHRRQKKRKNLLAATLRAFFRIEGEPFEPDGNGWRTQFSLTPDA